MSAATLAPFRRAGDVRTSTNFDGDLRINIYTMHGRPRLYRVTVWTFGLWHEGDDRVVGTLVEAYAYARQTFDVLAPVFA